MGTTRIQQRFAEELKRCWDERVREGDIAPEFTGASELELFRSSTGTPVLALEFTDDDGHRISVQAAIEDAGE